MSAPFWKKVLEVEVKEGNLNVRFSLNLNPEILPDGSGPDWRCQGTIWAIQSKLVPIPKRRRKTKTEEQHQRRSP